MSKNLKWIAYCLDCKETCAEDMKEGWNNGQMVEACARLHIKTKGNEDHTVLVGYKVTKEDAFKEK